MTQTAPVAQATTSWNLDPAHTTVGFSAKHMMITTVRGTFGDVKGSIVLDAANPAGSSVEAEIGVASIGTGVEQRDAHLRSPDFLDADAFPAISFRSKRVEGALAVPGDRLKVIGDLTIHGTTREVTLDATYEGQGADPWGGERVSFSASTRIDRRDFGLTWNQVLEAGGVLVSNEIKLEIEAQAVKA